MCMLLITNNYTIQVFSANGVYWRQFRKEGEGKGELKYPVSIAIDSHNVVYMSVNMGTIVYQYYLPMESLSSRSEEREKDL